MTLPLAPVVLIAEPFVYDAHVLPPLILTWNSSAAPPEPPVPALAVTVPVLKPAQIVPPVAGFAILSVGATGLAATGHDTIVTGPVPLQP